MTSEDRAPRRLPGAVAVVTGAAKGIGAATAARLGAEGAAVWLVDVDAAGLDEVVQRLVGEGADARAVVADVAEPETWQRLSQQVSDVHGRLDLLYCNAFVITVAPIHEMDPDQ